MMMKDTMSFSPDPTLFYSWAGYNNTEILAGSWHHYYSLKIGDICQPGSFPKISQWRDIRKLMNHSTRNVCSFSFISAKHERGEYVYSVLGMQQQCCSGTGNISALTGWSCVWVCQILNGNSGLSKEESELQLSLFSA